MGGVPVTARLSPGATPARPEPTPPRDWSRRAAVLVMLTVTVLAFVQPLAGRGAFLGTDIYKALPPWNADTPPGFRPHNWIVGDTLDHHLFKQEVWGGLRSGHSHLWGDELGAGMPLLPESPALSVLDLPYLTFPDWYAPGAAAAMRVLAAMVLSYGFLRRLGAARWASVLAGVAYGLTGFFGAWTNWPHTFVSSLIPGLFWAAEAIWQDPRLWRVAPLGLIVGAMVLGGFPAVLVYALYALIGYLLVRAVTDRRGLKSGGAWVARPLAVAPLVAAGFALGLLVAGVFLLPFVQMLQHVDLAYRRQPPGAHLPTGFVLTLLSPSAYGTHYRADWWGPSGNWPETVAYAGVAVLVLAGWALALPTRLGAGERQGPTRSLALALWGIVVVTVAVVFGLGGAVPTRLAQKLPTMATNAIGRARVIIDFGLAMLAGLGGHAWHRWLVGVEDRAALRRRLLLTGALLAVGTLGVLLWSSGFLVDYLHSAARLPRGKRWVARQFGPPIAAGLAALVLLGLGLWRQKSRRLVSAALVSVVAIEMLAFFLPVNAIASVAEFYPETPGHRFLAAHLGNARMAGTAWAFYPNSAMAYDLRDVRGHGFHSPEYRKLLLAVDPKTFSGGTPTNAYFTPGAQLDSPILDLLGVRYWAEGVNYPVRGRPVAGPIPDMAASLDASGGVEARLMVPEGGIRAAQVLITHRSEKGGGGLVTAALLDPAGSVLARSSRRMWALPRPGGWATFPLAAEGLTPGSTVHLRLDHPGSPGQLEVAADETELRAPAWRLMAGQDDSLRLVFADGVVIYERLTAQPLARFYGAYQVQTVDQTVRTLAEAPSESRREALLTDRLPGLAPGGSPPATPGAVTRIARGHDWVTVSVDADTAGVLVLAENHYPGWEAEIDGRPTRIVRADGSFQAVAVPPGEHTVRFTYRPASVWLGLAATALGLALAAALWWLPGPLGRVRAAPPRTFGQIDDSSR